MSTAEIEGTTGIHADRRRAGRISLVVGFAIFAGKFTAYALTGSSAVFADAMESTINIVSACMLLFALALAAKPPDHDHPYGHGRIEFLSASIEGAAITVTALVIFSESIRELIQGPQLASLDLGVAVLGVCTIGNSVLGRYLVRVGQATDSFALVADGRHIMSDVWTSLGVIGGLLIVRTTGFVWADPLVAIAVALHVAREGAQLLRSSFSNLMDQVDAGTIESVVDTLARNRRDSWIDAHSLRSWRSGARRHIDLHLTVPRFFDVEQIHAIHDEIETTLLSGDPHGGDAVVHFDPCEPALCRHCRMSDCRIRETAFEFE
ncbi:MAG: cation diffusion facilitator family transporter, partial [Myxococcota bacterium]